MKEKMISLLACPSAPKIVSLHGQGTIGFVGLGHMGTAMAANLAASGRRVAAYVRRPDQMGPLIGLGLRPTLEFANLFDCGVVISMLPDDAAVRDVVLGREEAKGLASGLKDGAIHLSMSTISTATASRLAAEHARYGQCYVAAPVFGNPDAARARQLFIVVAGAAADVERCQPLFDSIGQKTGKPRQAAWQHDDCNDLGDAGRSRCCSSQARTRSEGFRRHHDEHNVRRTRT